MGIVYLVRNKVNGMQYVGQTCWSLEARKERHEKLAEKGSKTHFHNAIRKYGVDAFDWRVLWSNVDKEDLNDLEIRWIELLNTRSPNGYNLTDGGDGFKGNHTEEAKRQISEKVKAIWADPVTAKQRKDSLARAATWTGRKHTEESKQKIRAAKLGTRHSPESIAKMTGRKQSPELIAKRVAGMAAARTGKPGRKHTEEAKAKIRSKLLGYKHTAEAKAKMGAARLGKKRGSYNRQTQLK